MTLRSGQGMALKMNKSNELKEFYPRSRLPPYLSAATLQHLTDCPDAHDRVVTETYSTDTGEADAAAGSMLTRVRSFGRLRNQPPQPRRVEPIPEAPSVSKSKVKPSWFLRDKTRTAGVGLVMALNIGTDPPDIIKPQPCAVLQTWMDPTSISRVSRAKAKEKIGERLQAQYEQWQQQRTATPLKYRRALDPTVEDVRALCLWLRRQARTDRILLHYNGHGVPRPTSEGELWLFDKNHTQYIPLMVTDLRQWMGKPNIVILDCSSAGVLMPFLTTPLETSNGTPEGAPPSTRPSSPSIMSDMDAAASQFVSDTIVLCPTSENEWLPMHPDYPADIFTSCLTTPIQMALRWFVRSNPQSMMGLPPEAVDSIPGKSNDRKTPLGELTWVFAAVTDSIAWNVLPRPLFQRLLRQDSLVAGMFRNFLLADRILRSLNCSPQSYPPLPPGVSDHPLWEAWDLACETCLYGLIRSKILPPVLESSKSDDEPAEKASIGNDQAAKPVVMVPASSVSSPFFSEQLSAFEIWLDFASVELAGYGSSCTSSEPFKSPEQLPIVLQVLLTPAYRVRALMLLRRFLDLGPWAVNLALSLGVLPYVTKLLQSPEYRQDLMGIWARILAFDPSYCQQVVLKDGGLPHFISHLSWGMNTAAISLGADPAIQRTMAAFILAATCREFSRGQAECSRLNLHGACSSLLASLELNSDAELDPDSEAKLSIAKSRVPPSFRIWLCVCLGCLVKDNSLVKNQALSSGVHRRLLARTSDEYPDVRVAACYALGCLVDCGSVSREESTSTSSGSSKQQQTALSVGGSAQPSLIPARLLSPPNPLVGSGMPGRLQPMLVPGPSGAQNVQWHQQTTAGLQQPQPIPLSVAQPQAQHAGYNRPSSSHVQAGLPGTGAVQTAFGGRPMDASYFGRSQATPMTPQLSHTGRHIEPRLPAWAVLQDESRIAYDVAISDGLLKASEDASCIVRYEAVISLSRVVEKYLPAFVALAGGLKTVTRFHDQQHGVGSSNMISESAYLSSTGAGSPGGTDTISLPRGIDEGADVKFTEVWNRLRCLQRQDPHPDVSSVANSVVRVVHERILRLKTSQGKGEAGDQLDLSVTESLSKREYTEKSPGGDPRESRDDSRYGPASRGGSTGLRALLSSPSISDQLPRESRRGGKDPDNFLDRTWESTDVNNALRRISSESASYAGWHNESKTSSCTQRPLNQRGKSDDRCVVDDKVFPSDDYEFPVSEFYEWQKEVFSELTNESSSMNDPVIDPLSYAGAIKSYREQRNRRVRTSSKETADHFACLAPVPPRPKKKRFDVDFEEDEATLNAANEESAKRKHELELKQSLCLTNDGAKMSSLLRFHSFEDALVVCDGHDGVSLLDTRRNAWACRFENGNARESRISSACWVNEHANSLLLVGCDNGSVRAWDGLVEVNGGVSSRRPSLSAAFRAVPDMIPGGDSGLKLEWQQFSGKLIAAGNSDSICCWDLDAEKCVSTLKTESEACVTTITTAWNSDPSLMGIASEGYRGVGPDIILVGHKDGSMRLFDIRANRSGAKAASARSSGTRGEGRVARHARIMKYDEHRNWIVSARFTAYGGRPEVVTGSVDGEVKMWDLRLSSSLRTYTAQRRALTAFSVHPRIPLVATGSLAQFIKLMTLDGEKLQVIRYHEALGGHQIGPVSCLEFHPHKPILAAGGTDSIVSIYSPKNAPSNR